MLNVAMQNCVHAQELDNDPPASVVQDAGGSWSPFMYDAVGCINTLELHLRHA